MNDAEIIAALSERNLQLLDKGWKPYAGQSHNNLAILDARGIPFEYLAFHLGAGNQSVLKPHSVIETDKHLCYKYLYGVQYLADC